MNEGTNPYEGPGWTRLPLDGHVVHFKGRDVPDWTFAEAYFVLEDGRFKYYKDVSLNYVNSEADRMKAKKSV